MVSSVVLKASGKLLMGQYMSIAGNVLADIGRHSHTGKADKSEQSESGTMSTIRAPLDASKGTYRANMNCVTKPLIGIDEDRLSPNFLLS